MGPDGKLFNCRQHTDRPVNKPAEYVPEDTLKELRFQIGRIFVSDSEHHTANGDIEILTVIYFL